MDCVKQKAIAKKLISFMLVICLIGMPEIKGYAQEGAPVSISAPSAILMEASTGTVIYEQNADASCSPASITKIMTMLLIFEALDRGDIKLEDEVMKNLFPA